MIAKVAILGAGAWGTAVAKVIAEKGVDTTIWGLEPSTCDDINLRRENTRFLPGVSLPASLKASPDIEKTAEGADYLILAIPSMYLLDTVKKILNVVSIREGQTAIAVLAKGFIPAPGGPRLIIETLEDYLPGFYRRSLVYIAGPSHAEEVACGKVTGLIAASESPKNSIRFRHLLKGPRLFVFSSFDVRGVQAAAAAKNVIAILFGMLEAIKNLDKRGRFGDGSDSLLLAAGLNEIQALGRALGATHPETFTSISGIGDLDVTCRSQFGRNRRFGLEIIEKKILEPFQNLDDIIGRIGEIGYLPEGLTATKYVWELMEKHKLKLPLCAGLHQILNREIQPMDFLESFLSELGKQ